MTDALKVSLSLYEGPLDLLLDLIRRQKIDVYDIPIADVTRQYLDHLHLIEEIDVDMAADFLPLAAQLIYIKSRMLLPRDPDANDEDDDPRTELVQRLLEHEKFKNAAQMLHQRELVEKAGWTRAGRLELERDELEPQVTATLFDMLAVFRDVLKRFEERPAIDVDREEYTVEQMAVFVMQQVGENPRGMRFTQLMARFSTRRALIAAFLALLELARVQAIHIGQSDAFTDIHLRGNTQYERAKSFSVA